MTDVKINGCSFNVAAVKKIRSKEKFIAKYKKGAYTTAAGYDKMTDTEKATQLQQLQEAWEFFNPTPKEGEKPEKPATVKK